MGEIIGTDGANSLRGQGNEDFRLVGRGGNDHYTLRLSEYTEYPPFGPPVVHYIRDKIVELPGDGTDTVTLVSTYNNVGFTGITPTSFIGPQELKNVEIVIATNPGKSHWNITAGAEDNTIRAPASADTLDGGAGKDKILAGGGADRLLGSAGADQFYGGGGSDTADYSKSAAAVRIDLSGKSGGGGDAAGDVLRGIESIVGSRGADALGGDKRANTLAGGAGDDALDGGAGNDALDGGIGIDRLNGGAGNDTFHIAWGQGGDRLTGGADSDVFTFVIDPDQVATFPPQGVITDFQDGIDQIVFENELEPAFRTAVLVTKVQQGTSTVLEVVHVTYNFGDEPNDVVPITTVTLENVSADLITESDLAGLRFATQVDLI